MFLCLAREGEDRLVIHVHGGTFVPYDSYVLLVLENYFVFGYEYDGNVTVDEFSPLEYGGGEVITHQEFFTNDVCS